MTADEPGAPGDDRPLSGKFAHSAAAAFGPRRARCSPICVTSRSAASPSSPGTRGSISSRIVSTKCRSEEHTSELQSLMRISYAVFCLKKKKHNYQHTPQNYTNSVVHPIHDIHSQ